VRRGDRAVLVNTLKFWMSRQPRDLAFVLALLVLLVCCAAQRAMTLNRFRADGGTDKALRPASKACGGCHERD